MIRKIFIAAIFAATGAWADAPIRIVTDLAVIDGDTFKVGADWLPAELGHTINLRVLGIDTPEIYPHAHCTEEAAMGKAAADLARDAIARAKVRAVQFEHWDKYGGRVDGNVYLDGISIKDLLLKSGLAHPYDGGKKTPWCGKVRHSRSKPVWHHKPIPVPDPGHHWHPHPKPPHDPGEHHHPRPGDGDHGHHGGHDGGGDHDHPKPDPKPPHTDPGCGDHKPHDGHHKRD